jgi:hypothetical protein
MTEKANTPATANAKAEKKLTFAELAALPIGDLATHFKRIVRVDLAIAKPKNAFTASLQFNAKCGAGSRK